MSKEFGLWVIIMGLVVMNIAWGTAYMQCNQKEIEFSYEIGKENSSDIYNINPVVKKITRRVGVYYPTDEIYCVDTHNLNETQIMETDIHERCHDLVHKKPKHFCGWYK